MKARLSNSFHGTRIYINVPKSWKDKDQFEIYAELELLAYQGDKSAKRKIARIDKTLCGKKDCHCGKIRK